MSPERISDLTIAALRDVIVDQRPTSRSTRTIADCLREPCDTARVQGVPPEELIVIVKHCWRGLADAACLDRREDTQLLGAVVRACIDEYYREELER